METLVLHGDHLSLPRHILKKFKGKRIRMMETDEGVLLKPVSDPIKEARGMLKDSAFSTEKYLEQKRKDKQLEQ